MSNSLNHPKTYKYLPIWMWGIVGIEILVPTYFAIASILDPTIWGELELGTYGELYVVRNFAMASGVAIAAVLLRSYTAVFATIGARFLADVADISAGFLRGPDAETTVLLMIFSVVLIVFPLIGLRWLFKQLKK